MKCNYSNLALDKTDDLPINHIGNVHSGKVRSCYWLNPEDSKRLINKKSYDVHPESQLGVMVISDRISAFDVNWKSKGGLKGVPSKGAALNAISYHWFKKIEEQSGYKHHVLESPHPLVWIVQRAAPIMVEAISRQYITGSMWRAYDKGKDKFCGNKLPEDLTKNQRLEKLLLTPTTKGILKGLLGVPEKDDTPITHEDIEKNFKEFGFKRPEHIGDYIGRTVFGFRIISNLLEKQGMIFVDTKFEFGYIKNEESYEMIFIDEVGTPDSSRIWDATDYKKDPNKVTEKSKEYFRQYLLDELHEIMSLDNNLVKKILIDSSMIHARKKLTEDVKIPLKIIKRVSGIYSEMAEIITGEKVITTESPRSDIIDALNSFGIIK